MSDSSRHRYVLTVALALVLALLAPVGGAAGTAEPPSRAAAALLTISAPASVSTGARIAIAGVVRVKNNRPRYVRLYEKRGTTWVFLLQRRSSTAGRVSFSVAGTAQVRTRSFQLRARRTLTQIPATSRIAAVRVVGKYPATTRPPAPLPVDGPYDPPAVLPSMEPTPAGSPQDWSSLFGDGSRWNPCEVITWAYNPLNERYAGALADARTAVARLSVRSGLRFRFVGLTDARGGSSSGNQGIGIVVDWAGPAQVPAFQSGSAGEGSASGYLSGSGEGYVLAAGYVHLNRYVALPGGHTETGPANWGQVMSHEFMHALGLGHAQGPAQLMYPVSTSANHRFGAGDLAGLAQVGSTHGCWS